jgi:hypothetical protein
MIGRIPHAASRGNATMDIGIARLSFASDSCLSMQGVEDLPVPFSFICTREFHRVFVPATIDPVMIC